MRRKSACIVNEKVFVVVLVVLFLSICSINKNTFGSGECISGDCKNGKGAASFSNGDKYKGKWKDGKMHGHGTYTWENGNQYVGEWRNGKEHGHGTKTFSNGDKYVGEWRDEIPAGGWYHWAAGNKVWAYKDSDGKNWVHLDSRPNKYSYPNAEFKLIDYSSETKTKRSIMRGIRRYKCECNDGLIYLTESEQQKGLKMRNLDRKDFKKST